MQDLSSPTRDQTHCVEAWSLNHSTAREVPWAPCFRGPAPHGAKGMYPAKSSLPALDPMQGGQEVAKGSCGQRGEERAWACGMGSLGACTRLLAV